MHLLKMVKSFQPVLASKTRRVMFSARLIIAKTYCCRSLIDYWFDYYISQTVDGLGSISLLRSNSKNIYGKVYTGNDCEWIDLNKVD